MRFWISDSEERRAKSETTDVFDVLSKRWDRKSEIPAGLDPLPGFRYPHSDGVPLTRGGRRLSCVHAPFAHLPDPCSPHGKTRFASDGKKRPMPRSGERQRADVCFRIHSLALAATIQVLFPRSRGDFRTQFHGLPGPAL
jgi:hypothetical protein